MTSNWIKKKFPACSLTNRQRSGEDAEAGLPHGRIMEQAIFRGTKFSFVDLRCNEGGAIMRIKVEADYTDVLMGSFSQFHWSELPSDKSKATLIGSLAKGKEMEFTPNGINKPTIKLSWMMARKFTVHRIPTDTGGNTVVVRFEILSGDKDPGIQAFQDNYNVYQQTQGQMVLRWDEKPEPKSGQQTLLPEAGAPPPKRGRGRPKKNQPAAPATGGVREEDENEDGDEDSDEEQT